MENMDLINETIDTIYDDIIPEKLLADRVIDAITTRKYQRNKVNRSVLNKILIKSSNSMSESIENVELRRDKFLRLLDTFV